MRRARTVTGNESEREEVKGEEQKMGAFLFFSWETKKSVIQHFPCSRCTARITARRQGNKRENITGYYALPEPANPSTTSSNSSLPNGIQTHSPLPSSPSSSSYPSGSTRPFLTTP